MTLETTAYIVTIVFGTLSTISILLVWGDYTRKWVNKTHVSWLEKRALIATELEKEQIRKRRSAVRRYYKGLNRDELLNKHHEFCFVSIRLNGDTEHHYPFGNTLLRNTGRGMKNGSGEYERVVGSNGYFEHRFTWQCEKHKKQHFLTVHGNTSRGSGGCTDWCGD